MFHHSDANLRIYAIDTNSRHSHTIGGIRIGHRGFTLIELLVVVAIVGILATVVTVSSSASRAQARDAQRKADLQNVAAALEVYRATNKSYPDIQSFGGSWDTLKSELFPQYISQWPEDPQSQGTGQFGDDYVYASNKENDQLGAAGSYFAIDAALENESESITASEINQGNNGLIEFFITGTYQSQGFGDKIHYRVSSGR